MVEKLTWVVFCPLHNTCGFTALTCAVGFTVIVKTFVEPMHALAPLVKVGVTVMVATTGVVPVLRAVKAAMLPVPEAPSPMDGLSLVHAYVVVPPVLLVVNTVAEAVPPLQAVMLAGWVTWADGLTVTVKGVSMPEHPLA